MYLHRPHTTRSSPPGYILIVSLLMLATLTTIATYIMTRGSIYVPFMRTIQEREKAIVLARGGIEIARAQLSYVYDQEESEKSETSKPGETKKPSINQQIDDQLFLMDFIPTINRWQYFGLTEQNDGIDGSIRICTMCEEGKINLNTIYDYKKKQFIGKGQQTGDWDAFMQEICKKIEQAEGGTDVFKALSSFLKKRTYKLIDVTELLHIPAFSVFKARQRYQPPSLQHTPDSKAPLYLADIFTVDSHKKTINPWVFSNALAILLELPTVHADDTVKRLESVEEWFKEFRQPKTWKTDWTALLQPMYQKDLSHLPKNIEVLFDTSTNPRIFSVISEAQVGTVTRQLYALLERTKRTHHNKTQYNVQIKKLYWL